MRLFCDNYKQQPDILKTIYSLPHDIRHKLYMSLQYYMHNKGNKQLISIFLNRTVFHSNVKHIHNLSAKAMIKMKFQTSYSAKILKNKNQSASA